MFEYFKAKKREAVIKAAVWGKVYEFIDNLPDIVELAKRAKDMNIPEVQKMVVEEIVKYIKTKEENVTSKTNNDKSEDNVSIVAKNATTGE